MAENYRSGLSGERGLSEVVGFVLIIGLLVVVFSLYLTYGIPVQGRENEIVHMNAAKDQFVSYKLSLDSLFNNNKIGSSVSNSFTLGTGGGYTQGMLSFIPVMSPMSSSGVVAINDRTAVPETLSITSDSLVLNDTYHDSVNLPARIDTLPAHIYVTFSGITGRDLAADTSYGIQVNGSGWLAMVNYTPETTYYTSYVSTIEQSSYCTTVNGGQPTSNPDASGQVYCLRAVPALFYNGTDILLTVYKGNTTTLQSVPIYRNVSSGIPYTVDLMDEAYGLKSAVPYPDTLFIANTLYTYNPSTNTPHIIGNGNVTYSWSGLNYTVPPIPLGALEYRARNNYWIPQTYYYQMGGVFLAQNDGNITYKLPPEISFSYTNDPVITKKIVTVSINALTFDQNDRGIVGGSSSVQVKSTLGGITTLPYAPGIPNTRWVRLAINTTDNQSRTMWKNYFDYTAGAAGMPPSSYSTGFLRNESYIFINGYDTTDSWDDISVIATNATYSTSIFGASGVVS
jgi:hypothetical protein